MRKADVEDKYSFGFLNGQVRPAALVDIFCANRWDPATQQMKYRDQPKFKIHLGSDNKALQYDKAGGPPTIASEVTKETSLWFKLEEEGFVITNGTSCLASQDPEVAQGSQCLVQFRANASSAGRGSSKEFLWQLSSASGRPDSQDYPYFHVEMTYGEVKPRLIYSGSALGRSRVAVSTRNKRKEYALPDSSVWKIFKAEKEGS